MTVITRNTDNLRDTMRGRWRHYFESINVVLPTTANQHGPCPYCGGKDRFRFDDKHGSGSHICSQCGAGDGFSLLMKLCGYTFPDALDAVEAYIGTPHPLVTPRMTASNSEPKQPGKDSRKQETIQSVNEQSVRIGWPMVRYFQQRGLCDLAGKVPEALRYHPGLPYWSETDTGQWKNTGIYPVILGKVTTLEQELVTLHRLFITEDGHKAPVPSPKKLMSPAQPETLGGCSIKLGTPTDTLYLTEGIETGLAVMLSTGGAVWACISASLLEQVDIPDTVSRVYIAADKDRTHTGEIAANKLAQRLLALHNTLTVKICLPPGDIKKGEKSLDWLDVYQTQQQEIAA